MGGLEMVNNDDDKNTLGAGTDFNGFGMYNMQSHQTHHIMSHHFNPHHHQYQQQVSTVTQLTPLASQHQQQAHLMNSASDFSTNSLIVDSLLI